MSDHDEDLPELDEGLRDLFASEHARPDVPADLSARLLARVHATIAMPPVADVTGDANVPADAVGASSTTTATASASTAVTAAGSTVLTKGVIGIALVSFAAGAGVGAFGHARLVPAPEPEVRFVVREVIRNVAVPSQSPRSPVAAPETSVASDAGARIAHEVVDGAVPPTPTEDAGTPETGRDLGLADENALVSRAQTALARGRAGEALEALSEHQRRFPRGQFTEEREALAIQALARLGRMEQATARAERFRSRYPGSLMMRVVDAAVRTP